jgi:hypothetical protein
MSIKDRYLVSASHRGSPGAAGGGPVSLLLWARERGAARRLFSSAGVRFPAPAASSPALLWSRPTQTEAEFASVSRGEPPLVVLHGGRALVDSDGRSVATAAPVSDSPVLASLVVEPPGAEQREGGVALVQLCEDECLRVSLLGRGARSAVLVHCLHVTACPDQLCRLAWTGAALVASSASSLRVAVFSLWPFQLLHKFTVRPSFTVSVRGSRLAVLSGPRKRRPGAAPSTVLRVVDLERASRGSGEEVLEGDLDQEAEDGETFGPADTLVGDSLWEQPPVAPEIPLAAGCAVRGDLFSDAVVVAVESGGRVNAVVVTGAGAVVALPWPAVTASEIPLLVRSEIRSDGSSFLLYISDSAGRGARVLGCFLSRAEECIPGGSVRPLAAAWLKPLTLRLGAPAALAPPSLLPPWRVALGPAGPGPCTANPDPRPQITAQPPRPQVPIVLLPRQIKKKKRRKRGEQEAAAAAETTQSHHHPLSLPPPDGPAAAPSAAPAPVVAVFRQPRAGRMSKPVLSDGLSLSWNEERQLYKAMRESLAHSHPTTDSPHMMTQTTATTTTTAAAAATTTTMPSPAQAGPDQNHAGKEELCVPFVEATLRWTRRPPSFLASPQPAPRPAAASSAVTACPELGLLAVTCGGTLSLFHGASGSLIATYPLPAWGDDSNTTHLLPNGTALQFTWNEQERQGAVYCLSLMEGGND